VAETVHQEIDLPKNSRVATTDEVRDAGEPSFDWPPTDEELDALEVIFFDAVPRTVVRTVSVPGESGVAGPAFGTVPRHGAATAVPQRTPLFGARGILAAALVLASGIALGLSFARWTDSGRPTSDGMKKPDVPTSPTSGTAAPSGAGQPSQSAGAPPPVTIVASYPVAGIAESPQIVGNPVAASSLAEGRMPEPSAGAEIDRSASSDSLSESAGRDLGAGASDANARIAGAMAAGDRALLDRLLGRYERAYDTLDADAASSLWPSVDRAALGRAFGNITEQDLSFERCDVEVSGDEAQANCLGSLNYVHRAGDGSPQTQPLSWTFRFRRAGSDWRIARVEEK
jgi:hypothetical protein